MSSTKAAGSRNRSAAKKPNGGGPAAASSNSAMNHQNRAHAATRTPVEQIAQICAQKAASARGDLQQEWFELGSYVSRFAGMGQPAGEGQRTMAAGG